MHLAALFCLGLIATAVLARPVHSQDADDALRLYAIHIDRTQMQPLNGYGVYLGNGIVITAAHVVGGGDATKPQVKIAGEHLPTKVVKDGNVITAGGVTSGIDFGLNVVAEIAGETTAQAIQLGIEYDPAPPFDSGHPDRVPADGLKSVLSSRYEKANLALRASIEQAANS